MSKLVRSLAAIAFLAVAVPFVSSGGQVLAQDKKEATEGKKAAKEDPKKAAKDEKGAKGEKKATGEKAAAQAPKKKKEGC